MRIAEISDPLSFHTGQWVKHLLERNVESYVVYIEEWIGSSVKRTPELNCELLLLKKPSRTKLISSMLKNGQFGALIKGLENRTSLHSELEFYGPMLQKYFEEYAMDIVHGHQLTSGALLAHASKFKPTIISAWGSDLVLGPEKYPYLRPLIKSAIKWADVIHTESNVSANIVKQAYSVDDDRFFISSWGVNTDIFIRDVDTENFREKYGIGHRPVVISFRTLNPFYRIDLIIRAFAFVIKEHPDAILLIGSDGPLKDSLVSLCKDLGINESVIFTGYLKNEDVAKAFAASDVYVQCPINDGVSISGMQAMSAGVPIVANNVGEVAEFVEDGVSGFFVDEPENPRDFAEKISLILGDDSLRKKLSSNSRRIALKKHNRKLFLDKYITLVEKLKEQYQR